MVNNSGKARLHKGRGLSDSTSMKVSPCSSVLVREPACLHCWLTGHEVRPSWHRTSNSGGLAALKLQRLNCKNARSFNNSSLFLKHVFAS